MTCPKQMVYGPCAGVTADGGCEVDAALPCPFVDAPTVRWAGPEAIAAGAPAAVVLWPAHRTVGASTNGQGSAASTSHPPSAVTPAHGP